MLASSELHSVGGGVATPSGVPGGVDHLGLDGSRIVEFRVMLRPLKAINLVHRQMGEALDALARVEKPTTTVSGGCCLEYRHPECKESLPSPKRAATMQP
mgnify:FL=1